MKTLITGATGFVGAAVSRELLKKGHKVKALVRKDTLDEWIVKEVIGGTYKKLNIKSTDVALDIGLNIGMF